MTGLTAKTFGLAGRGVAEAKASLPTSRSSTRPRSTRRRASRSRSQPAKGIETVIVNGALVWQDGKPTGARPGRVLGRSG